MEYILGKLIKLLSGRICDDNCKFVDIAFHCSHLLSVHGVLDASIVHM